MLVMVAVILPSPAPWTRQRRDAVLAGVCALLAHRTGLPVAVLRLVMLAASAATAFTAAVGLVNYWSWDAVIIVLAVFSALPLAYAALWWALPLDDGTGDGPASAQLAAVRGRPAAVAAPDRRAASSSAASGRSRSSTRFGRWLGLAAVASLAAGIAMVFFVAVPVAITGFIPLSSLFYEQQWAVLVVVGAAMTGAVTLGVVPLADLDRDRRTGETTRIPGGALTALAIAIAGMLATALGVAGTVVGPGVTIVLAIGAGGVAMLLAVVLVPWGRRLWRGIREETEARALVQHRSEMTAHLHDSVLQTFAMMQRPGMDPEEVRRLARRQERELRGWLYRDRAESAEKNTDLRTAVEMLAAEMEDAHGVSVDAVVVGAGQVPRELMKPLLGALREATLNACRHGGEDVAVFVDIAEGRIEAYVRDRGPGFDLEQVPRDRLGVRESIIGRLRRAGGTATVRPAPGGGTEVALELPWSPR